MGHPLWWETEQKKQGWDPGEVVPFQHKSKGALAQMSPDCNFRTVCWRHEADMDHNEVRVLKHHERNEYGDRHRSGNYATAEPWRRPHRGR